MPARNTREIGDRVERLLADLSATADPAVAEKAEELARALVELYGAGLDRILTMLAERPEGEELIDSLAGDDFIASLLVLHGLHPVPVDVRVQEALDRVRPYLGSHAGGVEYLGIDHKGVAQLALQGSCDGCPSSTVTVKLAIERAIEEAAPELAGIEVSGVVAEQPAGPKLLQIQPYRPREPTGAPGWFALPDAGELPAGAVRATEVAGFALTVCRVGGNLYAYRDACPHCGSALADGRLDGVELTCPACQRRFDIERAGRGLGDAGGAHLDPVPLVTERGEVRVALPAVVGT
jgi:Fe-S cluster biogenesis protein NfuA/nitrite reductase/ring-hydroxylating ferredoxin subunit